ncbi:hypothetical protein CYLTODRAFT_418993 [Cylindrobasidium torrendii FP15055 ss-10]|uniref:Uncharacterized protein n=1 Tax=Cylindrobasidium torrendii FP15055 ss-10 TaxID=1314674 RepID=A0A0D7BMD1_9AGAR|nr:hypothetical protein CYLTODRAFT_418993 [Cylindrobasidium torrendii FP15055 ss-10]
MGEEPYCINPQLILGLPQSYDQDTHGAQARRRSTTRRHQVYARPPPTPTPQSLLDGTYFYDPSASALHYASASPTPHHTTTPHVKPVPIHTSTRGKPVFSITTTVSGQTWPSLMDILRSQVVLDNATHDAFEVKWKRTRVSFEWPGMPPLFYGVDCTDIENHPLTLDAFVREIAVYIIRAVRKVQKGPDASDTSTLDAQDTTTMGESSEWDLRNIHIERIRIRGFRYYQSVWVPLLGVSSA